jgi:hypothetical protein
MSILFYPISGQVLIATASGIKRKRRWLKTDS